MSVRDIMDRGSVMNILILKTNKKQVFKIVDDQTIVGIPHFQKYAKLQPSCTIHNRFFLQFMIKIINVVLSLLKKHFQQYPKAIAESLILLNISN